MQVTAVIVTRGDVPMGDVLENIDADEIIIRRGIGGVYERYESAISAKHDVIFTQDDDCSVDMPAVVAAYRPGFVTCNMPPRKRPEYPDGIALVGWGAAFDKSALAAFRRYLAIFPDDDLFRREADRVFTGLNPLNLIDVPFEHLPPATKSDRMGAASDHLAKLAAIRSRIYEARK